MKLTNPEIKVVIINGSGGVGKDTFVKLCANILAQGEVMNVSSVTPAKEEAMNTHGWDGVDKSDYWREKLLQIKQKQIEDNDLPTRYVVNQVLIASAKLVFIHIREADEIQKCVDGLAELGITTFNNLLKILLIINLNIEVPNTKVDIEVEQGILYTDVIDNSGTIEQLNRKAYIFLDEWGLI